MLKRWSDAAELLTGAVSAINLLYTSQALDAGKDAWLGKALDAYRLAAYSLARLGRLEEAVVALEQGRAKGLNALLTQLRVDLNQIHARDGEAYRLYIQAAARVQDITSAQRKLPEAGDEPGQAREDVRREEAVRAYEELAAAIQRIRQVPGFERFLSEPAFGDVVPAVKPGQPLVYLITTEVGSLALIAYLNDLQESVRVEAVWADEFKLDLLNAVLLGNRPDVPVGLLYGQIVDAATLQSSLEQCLPIISST